MESTNFHHHQHRVVHHQHGHQLQLQLQQDDQHDTSSSSSSLVSPSWYLASSNNLHASWTLNNQSLNNNNNTANYFNNEHLNEENLCSNNNVNTRDSRRENDLFVPVSADLSSSSSNNSTSTNSMIPDLGFQYWTSNNNNNNNQSDICYPKFTEMLCSSAPREDHFNHQYDHHNSSSSYGGILGNNNINIPTRGNYSPIILPSINISNLNSTAASRASSENISSSLDMNLQALDLLTSARFTRTFSDPSAHSLALLEENPSFAPHNLHQQSVQRSPSIISSSYKMVSPSRFINGVTTATEAAKRPNNSTVMEPKSTSLQAPAKKSRVETRACPPFKVRKEKLGDRIANLQQMVAPFGKTDTASVLMEAIGYIKFLQNQVETLSVPYMKSSHNNSHRSAQYQQSGSSTQTDQGDGSCYNEETNQDLKSRGLCLVPLSCLSYITNDGGGGIWPHNDYHGCT